MTAEEIKKNNPIDIFLESKGVKLIGGGDIKTTNRCARVEHKPHHQCVTIDTRKGVFHCNDCKYGGDVITWMAEESGKKPADVLREAGGGQDARPFDQARNYTPREDPENGKGDPAQIDKIYPYENELGEEVFCVIRMKPKSFRQWRKDGAGNWIRNMTGVNRVLYRLPDIQESTEVAFAEGEKDAETLVSLGYCGTCNAGGAGKWMEGYTDSLAGKDVLIFGDNDKPGQDHVKLVFESISGKARRVKIIKIPDPYKDVTEYVQSFTDEKEARVVIAKMVEEAHPFVNGVAIKLLSMAQIEPRYKKFTANPDAESFDLSKWLPSFKWNVRNLMPGEVVLIVGDTGTGKTGLLQSVALAALPLPTVMFEMELPAELLYERFLSAKNGWTGEQVQAGYQSGDYIGEAALNHHFKNLFICEESSLTTSMLEATIVNAERVIGMPPKLVLLDYAQLLIGEGKNRYERASNAAESVKRIAKKTKTIIFLASQRGRPGDDDLQVGLHDGKESGSLENSAGLVLGVWRDDKDKSLLHMDVLKNTKGQSGLHISCNFDGAKMRITERAKPSSFQP